MSAEDGVVLTLALPKPPFPEPLPNTWILRYLKINKQFRQACSFLLPYKQVKKGSLVCFAPVPVTSEEAFNTFLLTKWSR